MKKKHSKIHKFIIKSITALMLALFCLSVAAMDSEAFWPPVIGLVVSFAWLWCYAWANGYVYDIKGGAEDNVD